MKNILRLVILTLALANGKTGLAQISICNPNSFIVARAQTHYTDTIINGYDIEIKADISTVGNAHVVFNGSNSIKVINCKIYPNTTLSNNIPCTARVAEWKTEAIPSEQSVKPYPIPLSEGTLFFGQTVENFYLYDSKGILVKSGKQSSSVEVDEFAAGLYYLKTDTAAHQVLIE